jgi:hypothetical protein
VEVEPACVEEVAKETGPLRVVLRCGGIVAPHFADVFLGREHDLLGGILFRLHDLPVAPDG